MKLYAPKYYKRFKCIADRCEHSCCIGWEIDIDGDTMNKYQSLKGGYADAITDSISMDGTPHFKLAEHDRCPHLDDRGLCRIITSLGEDCLCGICREHPRFYNYTDIAEVGLGMSCREAARIILSSPDYLKMEVVGEVDAEEYISDFDSRAERDRILTILGEGEGGYAERLSRLCREYSVDAGDDGEWLDILDSLEYLDAEHKKLFMSYSSSRRPTEMDEYLERAMAYFIYRHCTEAEDGADLCDRLSFCLFCERLLASLISTEGASSLCDVAILASIISEELEYSDENTTSLTYR